MRTLCSVSIKFIAKAQKWNTYNKNCMNEKTKKVILVGNSLRMKIVLKSDYLYSSIIVQNERTSYLYGGKHGNKFERETILFK